jgi:hypothetical protein
MMFQCVTKECVMADRVTRFAEDLLDAAAVEGARQSRSAKQQLDHWARVGQSVSLRHSTARRRVEEVLAGRLPLRDLGPDERLVANAELDVAISERAAATSYGEILNRQGLCAVAVDADGTLTRFLTDGSVEAIA